MPFKSKSQQRYMFAAEDRGDIPKGTAERWAKHTKNIKKLPEKKKKDSKEKAAFTRAFVSTFLSKVGMASNELANSSHDQVLLKLAERNVPADLQSTLDQAAKAKAKVELGRSRLLTNVGTPFMGGALAGSALAKLFRPSDVEVGNLQKKELLAHYDEAIKELERRILARKG